MKYYRATNFAEYYFTFAHSIVGNITVQHRYIDVKTLHSFTVWYDPGIHSYFEILDEQNFVFM